MRILHFESNFVVVELPKRRFPGIVVQGDTFASFLNSVEEARQQYTSGRFKEGGATLALLSDQLGDYLDRYERVLREHQIRIPYTR